MLLYHGSNEAFLPAIRKEGLKPRGTGKSQWKKYPSRPDMVYLTVAYPFYFSLNIEGRKGRPLVLEIDSRKLAQSCFFPDEDFIVQTMARGDTRKIAAIHTDIRNRLEDFQKNWKGSIKGLGNCCYKGIIPPTAIKRVCFFKPKARPFLARLMNDPQISLLNFHICKAKYTTLVAWMFGDTPELPNDNQQFAEAILANPDQLSAEVQPQIQGILKMAEQEKTESKDRTGIEVVAF